VSGGAGSFFGIAPSSTQNSPTPDTPTKRTSSRLKSTPTPVYSPSSSRKIKSPDPKEDSKKESKRPRIDQVLESPAPAVPLSTLQEFATTEQKATQGKFLPVTLKQRADELIQNGVHCFYWIGVGVV
jgi:hypothetical protein